jgi:hypothetical protein
MTGRPAEVWRKFKFATPPDWAYALLILVCLAGMGIIVYGIIVALVAQRATGFLPLTRSSNRTLSLAFWVPIGLLGAWLVAWTITIFGFFSGDPVASTITGVFFWMGLLFFGAGLIGRLILMPLVSPRAKVMPVAPGQTDRIVELRNVHPVFVAAVLERHRNRATQLVPTAESPYLLGSN